VDEAFLVLSFAMSSKFCAVFLLDLDFSLIIMDASICLLKDTMAYEHSHRKSFLLRFHPFTSNLLFGT
jgi:hypothetical protein